MLNVNITDNVPVVTFFTIIPKVRLLITKYIFNNDNLAFPVDAVFKIVKKSV